jgi:hypothetical protein
MGESLLSEAIPEFAAVAQFFRVYTSEALLRRSTQGSATDRARKQKCRTQIVFNPHSAFLVSNQSKTELCVTVSEFFKPRRFSLSRS